MYAGIGCTGISLFFSLHDFFGEIEIVTHTSCGETLRQLGLSVEDEARCPKSGYSIDISPGS
jgi:hypothetical protein